MIGKTTSWGAAPQTPVSYGTNVKNAITTINVKSSTNYTFINKETNKLWVCRIIEQDENGLGYVNHALYGNESLNYKKYNFSTRSNTSNIIFEIKKVDGTQLLSSDIESNKIMIVEGEANEQTPYEPHTEQSVQIALAEPLRGIGEYKDTITKDGVVRKIKQIAVNEKSDLIFYTESKNTLAYLVKVPDATQTNCTYSVISDRFVKTQYIDSNDTNGVVTLFGKQIIFRVSKEIVNNIDTLKEWLVDNNITFNYVLDSPITEPLPESVQQQLQALHSENGVTHVFVDSGEVECGIKLTYRKEI